MSDPCPNCGGTGFERRPYIAGVADVMNQCPKCGGSGQLSCPTCHDSGSIWSGPYHTPTGERAGKMIPCPECGGEDR